MKKLSVTEYVVEFEKIGQTIATEGHCDIVSYIIDIGEDFDDYNEKFIEEVAEVFKRENKYGMEIERYRFDSGVEYLKEDFPDLYKKLTHFHEFKKEDLYRIQDKAYGSHYDPEVGEFVVGIKNL
jgi:argonaute-like protein implicated in RNA metabolism and viral defense